MFRRRFRPWKKPARYLIKPIKAFHNPKSSFFPRLNALMRFLRGAFSDNSNSILRSSKHAAWKLRIRRGAHILSKFMNKVFRFSSQLHLIWDVTILDDLFHRYISPSQLRDDEGWHDTNCLRKLLDQLKIAFAWFHWLETARNHERYTINSISSRLYLIKWLLTYL